MKFRKPLHFLAGVILWSASAAPSFAADLPFAFKATYRDVTSDPDKIWTGAALSPPASGRVTIHEYELRTPDGDWLISQIWNEDCSSGACPTRLVRLGSNGRREVIVDDMMHQVVPPDDPRLGAISANKASREFALHPFELSADGKALVNGDFKFPIGEAKP